MPFIGVSSGIICRFLSREVIRLFLSLQNSLTRVAVRDAAWVRLLPLPSVGPSMATGTALWYSEFNGRVLQSLAYIAGEGAHFLSFGEQGPRNFSYDTHLKARVQGRIP